MNRKRCILMAAFIGLMTSASDGADPSISDTKEFITEFMKKSGLTLHRETNTNGVILTSTGYHQEITFDDATMILTSKTRLPSREFRELMIAIEKEPRFTRKQQLRAKIPRTPIGKQTFRTSRIPLDKISSTIKLRPYKQTIKTGNTLRNAPVRYHLTLHAPYKRKLIQTTAKTEGQKQSRKAEVYEIQIEITDEKEAKRLQRALSHLITLYGGKPDLFQDDNKGK